MDFVVFFVPRENGRHAKFAIPSTPKRVFQGTRSRRRRREGEEETQNNIKKLRRLGTYAPINNNPKKNPRLGGTNPCKHGSILEKAAHAREKLFSAPAESC